MKITKTDRMSRKLKKQEEDANKGCSICPCCGERKNFLDYLEEGYTDKGIFHGTCKTYATGLFKIKNWKIDCYSCKTCGAEWESDPYEW